MTSRLARLALIAALPLVTAVAACSSDDATGTDDDPTTTEATADGSSTTATGGDDGGTFTLLAYNVAGLPQEISDENPEAHLPLISPKLADYDLVLTQEDFDWWGELASDFDFVNYHDRLWAEADQPNRTEAHPGPEAVDLDTSSRPRPEVGDGLAVGSRFALADTARVPWVGCFGGFDTSDGGAADCLAMKGFLKTTVTLADGVEVDVYDVHGEAGGTEQDQALQADDYEQLAAYIAEHSADRAVIVAGDTNLHTDDEHPDGSAGADTQIWAEFLAAAGLTDACTATGCDQPGRIDKVAFRSDATVTLEARTHTFHEWLDDAGDELSDHQPLEVTFAWTRA